jgi:hypothetical protein
MRKRKIVGLVLVLLPITAGWYGTRFIKSSYVFSLRADFDVMPKDDRQLENWARSCPGVVPYRVTIQRDAHGIRVLFIQVRDERGEPPLPPLEEKCKDLGYKGPDPRFRDERPE